MVHFLLSPPPDADFLLAHPDAGGGIPRRPRERSQSVQGNANVMWGETTILSAYWYSQTTLKVPKKIQLGGRAEISQADTISRCRATIVSGSPDRIHGGSRSQTAESDCRQSQMAASPLIPGSPAMIFP